MKSCCFTGHRGCKIYPLTKVNDELRRLIERGVTDFYSGGELGWDMLCAVKLFELKPEYPHIRLMLILPCPPEEQSAKWCPEQKFFYYALYKTAVGIEQLSDHYYDGCRKFRNQRLVDMADICLCWYDERRRRSGTGQTVRMAEKKGIEIINMFGK